MDVPTAPIADLMEATFRLLFIVLKLGSRSAPETRRRSAGVPYQVTQRT